MPEGSNAIVTAVSEESSDEISLRQRAAIARFREAIRSAEPLPPAYDEIVKDRMNIKWELDL